MCRDRFTVCFAFVLLGGHGVLCYGQSRPADGSVVGSYISGSAIESRSAAIHQRVHPLFDLNSPETALFPSDHFTVPDSDQITGRRVNLRGPNCWVRRSDCEDLAVINTLDGFSVNPRLSVPFDGPIDVSTVNSTGVLLVRLGAPWSGDRVSGINEIVWDPARNTLYAKSDRLLSQHTRYALIVTNSIRDRSGIPVEESQSFRLQRQKCADEQTRGRDETGLREVLEAASTLGIHPHRIVAATVFTTQSVTAVLEKIRDQIKAGIVSPARFDLGPNGTTTVFSFNDIAGIKFNQQTAVNPPSSIRFPSTRRF